MHTRTYVPMLGRFTSPDIKRSFSLFNPGNMNRYTYANGNPARYTDPTGMITCEKTDCKEHVEVTPDDEEEAGVEVNWTGTMNFLSEAFARASANGSTSGIPSRFTSVTPWSKSPLGLNAFGPYQLHIKELESRGIWIHGTMGPGWLGTNKLNSFLSPTSHGCVRCANSDILALHDLMPDPSGNLIKITTNPSDVPNEAPQN